MLRAVHAAFPGFQLVDHDLIAEGDRVASRWTVSGTHRGELAGAAPTGRKLAISGLSIYRIAGGKLAEGWVQDDTMQQLGAAAAPQEAPAGTA
jgi:predicted ester cyclase